MSKTGKSGPVLIELDEEARSEHLDRAASWFKNVQLTQAAFKELLGDAVDKVDEPHIKEYLRAMLKGAVEHERGASRLYVAIGRDPVSTPKLGGKLLAKSREVWADMIGLMGGAKSPWQDLQQLYISNGQSMSAFAVAEQLGLALGEPAILDITYPIIAQKSSDHLLLQECALEMCSKSILYKQSF